MADSEPLAARRSQWRGRLLRVVGLLAAGVLLGWLSVLVVLGIQLRTSWIRNGSWLTNLTLGSGGADAETRALTALTGLFALRRSEAVYFIADRDREGRALRTDSAYRVDGGPLSARWWSVTLYGSDLFLLPDVSGRHSFGKDALAEGGRAWSLWIGREPRPGHWLPTGADARRFYLVLRLYDPGDEVASSPESLPLPEIVRLDP